MIWVHYWVTITNPAIPDLTLKRETITLIDEFEGDSLALIDLYNATNGAEWDTIWDLSTNVSTWHGVDTADGRVTGVDLNSNSLTGTIPQDIDNLTELKELNLSNNSLTGPMPIEITNLAKLQGLNLSDNPLTGTIPVEISNLTNLQQLYLQNNSLTGIIPQDIDNLTELTQLHLNNNSLTIIPSEIGNLAELQKLNLSDNSLTIIPSEIGNLAKLQELNLSDNSLTIIPSEIGNLAELQELNLSDNSLTTIPLEIGTLIELQELNLSNNSLITIPSIINNLINLQTLNLQNISIRTLPLINSIPNDASINVTNNKLRFNSIISNLSDKNNNSRDGNFTYDPQQLIDTRDTIINKLGTSIELTVSDDQEGNSYQWHKDGIPIQDSTNQSYSIDSATDDDPGHYWVTITNPAASSLTLTRDTITLIDESIGDSLALVALYNATNGSNWKNTWDLDTNVIQWYGVTVTNGRVTRLILTNNSLLGTIPSEIGNLSNIQVLDLAQNGLTGTIPKELGNLKELTNLSLSLNSLTGAIPIELAGLNKLTLLNLYNNLLIGNIPPDLVKLEKLRQLSVSSNLLTGTVPQILQDIATINNLILSSNYLDSLPPLTNIQYDKNIDVKFNNLQFNDIISNLLDKDDNLRGTNFRFVPQNPLDTRDIIINRLGNSIELTVSDDHGDNVYQWFKNGDTIPEATNQSYTISSLSYQDIGNYWATITNEGSSIFNPNERYYHSAIRGSRRIHYRFSCANRALQCYRWKQLERSMELRY